jgi:hypothetical protein
MQTVWNVCPYCGSCPGNGIPCTGACKRYAPSPLPIPIGGYPPMQTGPLPPVQKGCICPPTSEKTCQRKDCGRK